VPESAASSARRKAAARAAARRRSAVNALRIGRCACDYAIVALSNGTDPDQARLTAIEMAGELVAVAALLRKAAWLSTADRRRLAVELAGLGMTTKQIADRLGVCPRSVRNYLHGR
jgi:DNA-binding NarL/FixJ family response regulator